MLNFNGNPIQVPLIGHPESVLTICYPMRISSSEHSIGILPDITPQVFALPPSYQFPFMGHSLKGLSQRFCIHLIIP